MADTFELTLPRDLRSAGEARRETAIFLAERCAPALLDDILIVTSELVTNAVTHTGGGCVLRVQCFDEHIAVEVHDDDTSPTLRRDADEHALRHGLGVVQTLTRRWGVERLPEGKCVWAEFAFEPVKARRPHADEGMWQQRCESRP